MITHGSAPKKTFDLRVLNIRGWIFYLWYITIGVTINIINSLKYLMFPLKNKCKYSFRVIIYKYSPLQIWPCDLGHYTKVHVMFPHGDSFISPDEYISDNKTKHPPTLNITRVISSRTLSMNSTRKWKYLQRMG